MGKEREMDTNVLKTFIAVCEYSGFSAAAKELGYTQSTVSSQIKQLEKELDVRLFDRYYHKINLTEKGVLVLQQARNILKAQAKMLDSLNSAESIFMIRILLFVRNRKNRYILLQRLIILLQAVHGN